MPSGHKLPPKKTCLVEIHKYEILVKEAKQFYKEHVQKELKHYQAGIAKYQKTLYAHLLKEASNGKK